MFLSSLQHSRRKRFSCIVWVSGLYTVVYCVFDSPHAFLWISRWVRVALWFWTACQCFLWLMSVNVFTDSSSLSCLVQHIVIYTVIQHVNKLYNLYGLTIVKCSYYSLVSGCCKEGRFPSCYVRLSFSLGNKKKRNKQRVKAFYRLPRDILKDPNCG